MRYSTLLVWTVLALVRHDSQTLNAAFDVSSGNVEGAIGDRRTEVDFVTVLDQLLAFASPQIAWRIVYDKVASFIDVALA